ncbi:thioesterase II family protein [Streptomyces sp. ISL-11]|uniref:thioesterase II family protein n=1 Tax=Streptomyces sp. ISL-11 TaxID=2819174 RepID=UPI001BE53AF9|nr:alpha/beta fold hydrolase [Streptomyces sp. ISL-11]MBT2383349.1 thioesterase [Streptomyces sp. ISL-11]
MEITQESRRELWLRPYSRNPDARTRLVCLPHAGGAPTFFRDWPDHLSPDTEVLAVCYPGRQERIAERCITDMAGMARELAAVLATLADRPLVLFGHSMGATIAYETARLLEREHGVRLAHLIVSGIAPPHRLGQGTLHLEADEVLAEAVVEAGAGDSAILGHPEFRELLMPAIRADYRLIETYRLTGAGTAEQRLDCPLTGYHGVADDDAVAGRFEEWARYSSRPATITSFPGGHFYLQDNEGDLVRAVARLLENPGNHSGESSADSSPAD